MNRGVLTWLRGHLRIVDAVITVPLLLMSTVGGASVPYDSVWWVALLVAGGLCGPVVIWRECPRAAFVIVALVSFAQVLLNIGLFPANLMLFAVLYNVASRCRWQDAAFASVAVELGAVLANVRWFAPVSGPSAWQELIPVTILVVSVWIWGNSVRTRRAYLASLEERAVHLARERDNQAQFAAAAERARIAREMHDVVSHGLSVITVQADGASYAIDNDLDRVKHALATISSTSRTAQTEMRHMLDVLRNYEPDAAYAPQPGIDQLDQLVEQVRQAGLPVELTVEGVPQQLPTGVQLAAYRVAQEALTNTLKHAGPNVSYAQLRLQYGKDLLEMHICDDGRGAAALSGGPPNGHDGVLGHRGHGLIGMRERVAAYGGSVRSEPKTGGGFEVVASLPLRPGKT